MTSLLIEIVDEVGKTKQKPCGESLRVSQRGEGIITSKKEAKSIDDCQSSHSCPYIIKRGYCRIRMGILHKRIASLGEKMKIEFLSKISNSILALNALCDTIYPIRNA